MNTSAEPRTIPTDDELLDLVKPVADKLVTEQAEFTAYGITLMLRHANPSIEIDHTNRVRDMVHDYVPVQYPDYDMEERLWSGEIARTYFPPTQKPIEEVDEDVMEEVKASGALGKSIRWSLTANIKAQGSIEEDAPAAEEEEEEDDFLDDDEDEGYEDEEDDDFDDEEDEDDEDDWSDDDNDSFDSPSQLDSEDDDHLADS